MASAGRAEAPTATAGSATPPDGLPPGLRPRSPVSCPSLTNSVPSQTGPPLTQPFPVCSAPDLPALAPPPPTAWALLPPVPALGAPASLHLPHACPAPARHGLFGAKLGLLSPACWLRGWAGRRVAEAGGTWPRTDAAVKPPSQEKAEPRPTPVFCRGSFSPSNRVIT